MAKKTSVSARDAGTVVASAGVKLQRSPMLAVVGAALVIMGGLFGFWLWTSTSQTVEVVVARVDMDRGHLIGMEELGVVRISVDPSMVYVPGADLEQVVGRRVVKDLAAGTVVAPAAIVDVPVPAEGFSIVAVPVVGGLLPSTDTLRAGDPVTLVLTSGNSASVSGTASVDSIPAVVYNIRSGDSSSVVEVTVPSDVAPKLALWAGTGSIAVVLESDVEVER